MPQGPSWESIGFKESVMGGDVSLENIYTFFRMECLRMRLILASFYCLTGTVSELNFKWQKIRSAIPEGLNVQNMRRRLRAL